MARKVGSISKQNMKLKLDLLETLKDKGYEPAAALIETRTEALRQYKHRLKESQSGFGSAGLLQIVSNCDIAMMEYVYPKLARAEVSAPGGKDLFESLGQFFVALDAQKKSDKPNL